MSELHLKLFVLALSFADLTAAHAVEKEKPTPIPAYGPAIHISSGILQLAPDSEQPQLLLLPSIHSNPSWPHFYVDTSTASHLPHSALSGHLPSVVVNGIQEPRILVNDNVDFSQMKLQQQPHTMPVHSYGR